jgi:hypothetical protein
MISLFNCTATTSEVGQRRMGWEMILTGDEVRIIERSHVGYFNILCLEWAWKDSVKHEKLPV